MWAELGVFETMTFSENFGSAKPPSGIFLDRVYSVNSARNGRYVSHKQPKKIRRHFPTTLG